MSGLPNYYANLPPPAAVIESYELDRVRLKANRRELALLERESDDGFGVVLRRAPHPPNPEIRFLLPGLIDVCPGKTEIEALPFVRRARTKHAREQRWLDR